MALQKESNEMIESVADAAGIPVYFTGFGLISAAYRTAEIIVRHQPTHILNLGTAGSRHHRIGRLVECTTFSNRTVDQIETLKFSIKVDPLTDLEHVHCGSADHIDTSDLAAAHDVLDMEAYAMALVCKKMNVKFNSIKYITDDSRAGFTETWHQELKTAAIRLHDYLQILIQTKVIG